MNYGFPAGSNFPSMVQISVTNVCDMSCTMCPHSLYVKKTDYKPVHMDYNVFTKIADEVALEHKKIRRPHPGSIRLLGWGEALTHPGITDMVGYAKDAGVNLVTMITNGLALNQKKGRALLEAGLDVIEVSLDAYTKEGYEKVRNNPHFERIRDNLLRFIDLRNELHARCYIAAGIIDQPDVHDEVEAFRELYGPKVEDVVVRKFRDFKGHVSQIARELEEKEPCRCLWARFNITPEGKATICYDDWEQQFVIGDLRESTIKEIWHSEELEKERQAHLEGKTYSALCAQCKTDRAASSWTNPYEKLLERVQEWKRS
jgi:radical SAM protein with 4Fe4S-binding SPASM domain